MRGINKDTLSGALSDRPGFREMNLGGGRVRHRTRAQEAEEVPDQVWVETDIQNTPPLTAW